MTDENAAVASQESAAAERVRVPIVAPGPHVAVKLSSRQIMLWVIGALLPTMLWSIWLMGVPAIVTYTAAIGACLVTEAAWNVWRKQKHTSADMSTLLTGILLAMCMPPLTPWWVTMFGGVAAIALGKMLFGGLGFNLFNPALVGRAVVLMSWLGVMSEIRPFPGGWYHALKVAAPAGSKLDAISGATRLAIASSDRVAMAADKVAHAGYGYDLAAQYAPLLWRNLEGCLGEVSGGLVILGGLVLLAKGIIDWRIPGGYIGSVALLSWAFGSDPVFNVLAGGVLLGAFFMATDYVTSPVTKNGKLVFGIGCGVFNIVTRFYGPMPETTTFAILFMNGLAPLLDRVFMPKPFGFVKPGKGAKANA